ncbi:PREDICTED: uncharacterized protein LOC105364242 [Ceratosolen solmsi marchali]|uniref:Uncharacterized protein LOC105364242 n=1 Tax=Ceratosolen solmsi marchali TaxID=326594 RepID=A0AAJ7DXW7_9HYME|nr:PREDICTED: uncharacterized protein LOC105364242 [Ceratosolen solmsi marchali]
MFPRKASVLVSLGLVLLSALLIHVEARKLTAPELEHHHRHRHRHDLLSHHWPEAVSKWRAGPIDPNGSHGHEDDYELGVARPGDLDYEEYADYEEALQRRPGWLYSSNRNAAKHRRYEPWYRYRVPYHPLGARGYDPRIRHRTNSRVMQRKQYKEEREEMEDEVDEGGYDDKVLTGGVDGIVAESAENEADLGLEGAKGVGRLGPLGPSGYHPGKYKSVPRKRITSHYSLNFGESKGARRPKYGPWKMDWRVKTEGTDDKDGEHTRRHAPRKGRQRLEESSSGRHVVSAVAGKPEESSRKTGRVQEDEEEEAIDADFWAADVSEDRELDNDFYKNDEAASPPLRTYDDIIRRLTEDVATTTTPASSTSWKPTTQVVKRDYRNTEIERHLRRDDYGNLRLYESKKDGVSSLSRHGAPPGPRNSNLVEGPLTGSKKRGPATKRGKAAMEVAVDEEVVEEEVEEVEEEEDRVKGRGDGESGTQADANTDYADDENEDENGSSNKTTANSIGTASRTTPSTTTTTTTTTTSTTTSTTARAPVANNHFERKEPRSYDNYSNGYQSKSEYPAMSAHSALKWQYLGTRETVKETRNSMTPFARNSKSAEMNLAHSHALRVAKEGSCQWPRARVIPVRDVYPNSTATYIPHCAILHRCSDDTGCCRSETLTCEAKHSQRVELYFYVSRSVTNIHAQTRTLYLRSLRSLTIGWLWPWDLPMALMLDLLNLR